MEQPPFPPAIPVGDMPGDKVQIGPEHIAKAESAFPLVWERIEPLLASGRRAVVAVAGGSGVGKSEVGALLAQRLRDRQVPTYLMSGDNYPRRIPAENDAERVRVFRVAGARALAAGTASVRDDLHDLQRRDRDADPAEAVTRPWLVGYQRGGARALRDYLGGPAEIDFDEVNAILAAFHEGRPALRLKRMGRAPEDLWYETVDMSDTRVLVLEWTHSISAHLRGADVAVLLSSTPEETLAHRRARARDGAVDSPFTTMVLGIEQDRLDARAASADVIVARDASIIDIDGYRRTRARRLPDAGPMLNAYPDSLGGRLGGLVRLVTEQAAGAFGSVYVLPSLYNTDLDRGFSVVDYGLNRSLCDPGDLDALTDAGLDLKLDFILNHASVLSPQFQDLLRTGERSRYRDFFIDWNRFWAGHGTMGPQGWIEPDPQLLAPMFFRKPGLPLLMVRFPDGREVPYWNTFYQEVSYPAPDTQDLLAVTDLQFQEAERLAEAIGDGLRRGLTPDRLDLGPLERVRPAVVELLESRRRYLGQMDLNVESPLVWDFYQDTLTRLSGYGASIVRLDAFAYASKRPGARNFLNEPDTWQILARLADLAGDRGLTLLPEIHASYAEGIHRRIAEKGFLTYDFFLPGLVIDAFENHDASMLRRWAGELATSGIHTVNMLGCHDGIPLLDLKGLLPDERIEALIDVVQGRGGMVKDLHGAKNIYYQVNATYFSALGESDRRLLLARAIQLFMPGKPQVWYLDLFAGRNDHDAVERAGEGGHKEINRTGLSDQDVARALETPVVRDQIDLLRFRTRCEAFGFDADLELGPCPGHRLVMTWRRHGWQARFDADLATERFSVRGLSPDGTECFRLDR